MKYEREKTIELPQREEKPSKRQLDEDMRRLELSQLRVIILKYPQDSKRVLKEMMPELSNAV